MFYSRNPRSCRLQECKRSLDSAYLVFTKAKIKFGARARLPRACRGAAAVWHLWVPLPGKYRADFTHGKKHQLMADSPIQGPTQDGTTEAESGEAPAKGGSSYIPPRYRQASFLDFSGFCAPELPRAPPSIKLMGYCSNQHARSHARSHGSKLLSFRGHAYPNLFLADSRARGGAARPSLRLFLWVRGCNLLCPLVARLPRRVLMLGARRRALLL